MGSDGTLLYFGYGANLTASALRERGVSPSASAVARAPGYELVFAHRGGYATIDPVGTNGEAWGVVHRVSRTELAAIRAWETGYETKELDVMVRVSLDADDHLSADSVTEKTETRVRALAFVTKPSARLRRPVVPFDAYAAKLARGAERATCPSGRRRLSARPAPRRRRGDPSTDVPSAAERLAGTVAEILKRF